MISGAVSLMELNGHPVLRLSGAVDTFVVKELYEAARTLLDRGEDTVVRWETAESVDVSTLQVLLALQTGLQAKGQTLQLGPCTLSVQHLLAVSGLSEALRATTV